MGVFYYFCVVLGHGLLYLVGRVPDSSILVIEQDYIPQSQTPTLVQGHFHAIQLSSHLHKLWCHLCLPWVTLQTQYVIRWSGFHPARSTWLTCRPSHYLFNLSPPPSTTPSTTLTQVGSPEVPYSSQVQRQSSNSEPLYYVGILPGWQPCPSAWKLLCWCALASSIVCIPSLFSIWFLQPHLSTPINPRSMEAVTV